jgi:tRNA pseudouridine38-40 synthase
MSPNYAFEIGYLGDAFAGYARQPGHPTVEGTIVEGLRTRGILASSGKVKVASRTDRGVHALGNVVSFSTPRSGPAAARVLNSLHPAIFCFGWAAVPEGFEPRHARERWYRYLEPAEGHDLDRWKRGAALFVGEHDFASFSRRDDPPRPPRGRVSRFTVREAEGLLQLDVVAPGFLWNQVRKMVAALSLLDTGRLSEPRIAQALRGEARIDLPLAPADRLVLLRVRYPFEFVPSGPKRPAQRRRLEETRRDARAKATLLGWFQSRELATAGSEE